MANQAPGIQYAKDLTGNILGLSAPDGSVISPGLTAIITPSDAEVGTTMTATLGTGIFGTFQWTRTTSGGAKSNISGAVSAAGVNSSTYTTVVSDADCIVGCDVSNIYSSGIGKPIKPPQYTGASLVGPSVGTVGITSGNFTVTLTPAWGTISGAVTYTPTPIAGVTFVPTSLSLTKGSPTGVFTVNASTVGAKTIALTNNRSLANPTPITFTASAVTLYSKALSASALGTTAL